MKTSLIPSGSKQILAAAVLALMSISCGGDDGDTPSGGSDASTTKPDAGGGSSIDSGLKDAGKPPIVVSDTGVPGTPPDAATSPIDAATGTDAATGGDAATGTDAAVPDAGTPVATIPTFNECTSTSYVDLSAPSADRKIAFGGTAIGLKYLPACIIIAAGQSVEWDGMFATHPLKAGTTETDQGSPNSPIVGTTNTGEKKSFTFPTAGTYPYLCTAHAARKMYGSVHVK